MKRKLWTVQTREVLEMIMRNGVYTPDFSLSTFPKEAEGMSYLYDVMLEAFNNVNHSAAKGLVFTFMGSDNSQVYDLMNFAEFRDHMILGRRAIESLWKGFLQKDCVIMELSYQYNFNPLPIDMNDFQFLMPPVLPLPPYSEADFGILTSNLYNGIIKPSKYPSGIIQAHVPYICYENILNVYQMFALE